MLISLSVRDFVIVDALELDFTEGFTVLTGETGAGKSILLDALSLLLGDRAEGGEVREGADRAELAAVFDIARLPALAAWLASHDLAGEDDELLIRRALDKNGAPWRSPPTSPTRGKTGSTRAARARTPSGCRASPRSNANG